MFDNCCIEYDQSFYFSTNLKYWGKRFAEVLPSDVTHLISASTSGAAIASAILVFHEGVRLAHTHVHPSNRLSHRGRKKESSGANVLNKRQNANASSLTSQKDAIFAFVDDFSDTGATFMGVYNFLKKKQAASKLKYAIFGMNGCVLPIKRVKIIGVGG